MPLNRHVLPNALIDHEVDDLLDREALVVLLFLPYDLGMFEAESVIKEEMGVRKLMMIDDLRFRFQDGRIIGHMVVSCWMDVLVTFVI